MNEARKKPIRVLHIVGGMNTGGVETWLMHILRRIDRARFQFDFLTHTTKPCFYDNEIRSLGSRVIPCMHPSNLWRYTRNFNRILNENGPYDVVHSHVHQFSGYPLLLAHRASVPVRIAHSHTNSSLNDKRAGFWRKFYLRCTEWLIRRYATLGLACSGLAAANLFGNDWQRDSRWRVFYCGIDLEPFKHSTNRDEVLRELGIPLNAFVLGHVGRFMEEKNHVFLLDIFAGVVRYEPKACLLLVGDGPLRNVIEQKTQRLGIQKKVFFAGMRSDVPRLMLGAMDVFVFPSRYEGLALVLFETQAANLPSVISDVISGEAIVVPKLVRSLNLQDDLEIWTQAVFDCAKSRELGSESLRLVSNSKFNVIRSVAELCDLYLLGKNS